MRSVRRPRRESSHSNLESWCSLAYPARVRRLAIVVCWGGTLYAWFVLAAVPLAAQPSATSPALVEERPATEGPDPTRLDVERLPPEAIELSRDLYAHGLFVDVELGGAGFLGVPGRMLHPGPALAIGLGYEVFDWLLLRIALEGSMHATALPPPPSPSVVDLVGSVAELRLQWNLSGRAAIWLGGEGGFALNSTDVLSAYGTLQGSGPGWLYGGRLGFDWHMRDRHASVGLFAGARVQPGLAVAGLDSGRLPPLGLRAGLYLRHVF